MQTRNAKKTKLKKNMDCSVCMIVNQVYYTDTRVISYAHALANTGVQVDIIGTSGTSTPPHQEKSQINIYSIPVKRIYQNKFSYILKTGLSLLLFTVYLSFLYLKKRYKVIHVHNMPDFLILTALIPRIFGAKLILDIHDPMPEFYMSKFKKSKNNLIVNILYWQEKLSSKLAHTIITANPTFKKLLINRGFPHEKITVVNNIPNPKLFIRPKKQKGREKNNHEFVLIYPGTIAPRYGLDIPIRALPQLVKSIPNIQFKIIGKKNKYSDQLIVLANQLGVSSYTQILPHVPAEQIPSQLETADLGVYTARPDPHMSIAVPGKVLEFVAMGLPIVASRLKVLEEQLDKSSILFFEPGSITQFTDCVLMLHQDPSLKKQLVQRADKLFYNKHSWKNELNKYMQLIRKLTA